MPSADLISPEQALYNLLNLYFDGTPAAASFGGTPGAAPFNYLQIYPQDIQYSAANANAPAQIVEASGATATVSAQAMLNTASQKVRGISEPAFVPAIAPEGVVPASSAISTIQSGEWASIFGTNLAVVTASWNGDFPTALAGTSVTIDSKPAYLAFVSPGQINLQVPGDAATGQVQVVVTTP